MPLAFAHQGPAPRENTTLAVVATDAALTKAQAKRLAVMAQAGVARAIYPVAHAARRRYRVCGRDRQKPLADPVIRA